MSAPDGGAICGICDGGPGAVAKRLNLLEKADRIALFQAALYGNPPS